MLFSVLQTGENDSCISNTCDREADINNTKISAKSTLVQQVRPVRMVFESAVVTWGS